MKIISGYVKMVTVTVKLIKIAICHTLLWGSYILSWSEFDIDDHDNDKEFKNDDSYSLDDLTKSTTDPAMSAFISMATWRGSTERRSLSFKWSGSSLCSVWSLFWLVRFFIAFNMILIVFFIIHSVVILALSYQYDHYKIALNWLSTTIFSFFELITNYQSLTCCWFSRWVVSRASMHCLVSMNAWVLMI